jgi:uncharacterized protein
MSAPSSHAAQPAPAHLSATQGARAQALFPEAISSGLHPHGATGHLRVVAWKLRLSSVQAGSGACAHPTREDATMANDHAQVNRQGKSERGFASMDAGRQREIASKGGKAAHESGRAHEFSSDEARIAGRKGGEAVSRDREHMSAIGRKGGEASGSNRAARDGRDGGGNGRNGGNGA